MVVMEDEHSGDLVTERFVFFWKPPSPFSQWTFSRFCVDGVVYSHAEQFMMAEKARLFGDEEACARIMASVSPRRQKALGQSVVGFDESRWQASRLDIVLRGNLAKFSQSPRLLRRLCSTGHRVLVEASPLDQVWGIGMRADDEQIEDPAAWRGQNLLGVVLMKVREQLCP